LQTAGNVAFLETHTNEAGPFTIHFKFLKALETIYNLQIVNYKKTNTAEYITMTLDSTDPDFYDVHFAMTAKQI
jgi:hypothetical protein